MDIVTAYIILGIEAVVVVALFIIVFYWMGIKNCVKLEISEYVDGVLMVSNYRGRAIENKFYSMRDLLKRQPLIFEENLEEHMLATESMPIIGVKKTIEAKRIKDKMIIWKHNNDLPSGGFSNNIVAWTDSTRTELYESTKPEVSKADQIKKLLIPMGLFVVALACLIFFPKIYGAIMENGNIVAETAVNRFTETMNKFIPVG